MIGGLPGCCTPKFSVMEEADDVDEDGRQVTGEVAAVRDEDLGGDAPSKASGMTAPFDGDHLSMVCFPAPGAGL